MQTKVNNFIVNRSHFIRQTTSFFIKRMLWCWILHGLLLIVCSTVVCSNGGSEVDHLQALGLSPPFYQFWDYQTPNENDVKAAYKAQSLLYHPDKNDQPDAMDKFIAIRNAYEDLKGSSPDAERRRKLAAAKYKHHGEVLRSVKHHIQQLPSYFDYIYKHYLIMLWRYAAALWNEFCNNPKDSRTRLVYNWNRISMREIVLTSLAAWLVWKALSFIGFTVSRKVKTVFSLSEEVYSITTLLMCLIVVCVCRKFAGDRELLIFVNRKSCREDSCLSQLP